MSYNDPVRLTLTGDRVVASRYIRLARGLLLRLARETFEAGSAQASRHIPFPNGLTIDIKLAGLEAWITIDVTKLKPELTPKIDEHFVVFPRTTDLPNGIDAETPQLMLRPEDDGWRTLFFDTDIAGYDSFEGAKGTYRTNVGQLAFPDGVIHSGNIDWVSNEGLRLSWYGPTTRYFYDAHTQPRSQYGKYVFMLGQILLDVEQYQVDSDIVFEEEYVMGAALRGTDFLYVVHANLPVGDTPTATSTFADITMPWPVGAVQIAVRRYAVIVDTLEPGVMKLKVAPGSATTIYSGALQNALQPWFFNSSCTSAVNVALPDNVRAYRGAFDSGAGIYTLNTPYPSESQAIHTLTVSNGSLASTNVGLPPGVQQATVACDFKGDTLKQLVVRRFNDDGLTNVLHDVFALKLGDFDQALNQQHYLGIEPESGRPLTRSVNRWVMHMDLREEVYCIGHLSQLLRLNSFTTTEIYRLEIWRGGVLVATKALDPTRGQGFSWTANLTLSYQYLDIVLDRTLAPSFALCQIFVMNFPTQAVYWRGRVASYGYRMYPTTEMFGAIWAYTTTTTPAVSLASLGTDIEFDGTQLDPQGQLTPLGVASHGPNTLYSGYGFGRLPLGSSLYLEAGPLIPTLPTLTGVSGPKERYHPIWLLGALPATETP